MCFQVTKKDPRDWQPSKKKKDRRCGLFIKMNTSNHISLLHIFRQTGAVVVTIRFLVWLFLENSWSVSANGPKTCTLSDMGLGVSVRMSGVCELLWTGDPSRMFSQSPKKKKERKLDNRKKPN